MQKYIHVKGARENNLKNIDIKIPKDQLVVMTGVSGSGKTSLAFDTIYAEGQRRYVESLSAYARQFLGNLDKPDVDSIDGLSPSISIDQKTTNQNPRSTVGTVTEIYDYLRLLYARVGHAFCPTHQVEISAQSIDEMVDKVFQAEENAKILIMSPVVYGRKGTHDKLLDTLRKDGFVRARINQEMVDLSDEIQLDKNKTHNIEVVVDRIKLKEEAKSRLFDSIETALKLGEGKVIVSIDDVDYTFSEHLACPYCDFSIPKLEPRLFSFNSPFGACDACKGLGFLQRIDEDLLVTNPEKSIRNGAIKYLRNIVDTENIEWQTFQVLANHYDIDLDLPYQDLPQEHKEIVMVGSKEPIHYEIVSRGRNRFIKNDYIEGVATLINRRFLETNSSSAREYYNSYMVDYACPTCDGKRLNEHALSVKIGGLNINEITELSIVDLKVFVDDLTLSQRDQLIGHMVLDEIKNRLDFLINVGLDYLTLDRSSGTLSGGESQRIRLATQIGSKLSGIMYVLDEPSIGLHQRDNDRLIHALQEMRDLGNTLIVVEHDEDIMRKADYLIDVGPYAGELGGEIIAAGTPEEVMQVKESITGKYLRGELTINVPSKRRVPKNEYIEIIGAKENNLKNIDVKIPLGVLNVVTGVSGSGKSTLVNEILYKNLMRTLYRSKPTPGKAEAVLGMENIEKVIDIDQSPIGRTPRSNPATYTGVFDHIRDLFATTLEAKMRGYDKGRFSFNVKGGRCEACSGDGVTRIAMNFLPDVYIPCEVCSGKRYNRETLEIKYKNKTISDVLEMTVSEALEFFQSIPSIKNKLETIQNVGLGYIRLGQNATTLSGGEAQRVKLSSELHKRITDKTIYILDEPTTGLHTHDIKKLMEVIDYIVEQGATVVIIEHNLDVIKLADNIIDLGPEGGQRGGEVVFNGTPEEIINCEKSYTGQYLKRVIQKRN